MPVFKDMMKQSRPTDTLSEGRGRSPGFNKRKKSMLNRDILGNRDELMSKIMPSSEARPSSSMDEANKFDVSRKKRKNLTSVPGL